MIGTNTGKVKIIGENIITNGKQSSAFYVMPGFSYELKKIDDINSHIDKIYQMFSVLYKKNPMMSFCLSKLDVPFTKREIEGNLKRVVTKWSDKGIRFEDRIKGGSFSLILLEIFLDGEKQDQDIDIKKSLQRIRDNVIAQTGGVSTDYSHLFELENEFSKMLSVFDVYRASRDLIFRFYLKNIFPGYSFNIDLKNIEYNGIMNNMDQFFNFKMGYFITKNDYMSAFGIKPREIYSSILCFDEFPIVDETYSFILPNDNMRIFVKTSDQKKLELALKRKKADFDFTLEKATKAGTTDIEGDLDKIDLITEVITRIKEGEIGCEAKVVKIISADSKKELDDKKTEFISAMLGRNIACYAFLDQEKAFKECFVERRPQSWNLMCDMRYMMSCKIDNFISVGDFDSKDNIGLTRIGETF